MDIKLDTQISATNFLIWILRRLKQDIFSRKKDAFMFYFDIHQFTFDIYQYIFDNSPIQFLNIRKSNS